MQTLRTIRVSDVLRRFADMLDKSPYRDRFEQGDPGGKELGRLVSAVRTYVLLNTRVDLAPGAVTAEDGDPLVTNRPNQIRLPFQSRKIIT